MWPLRRESRLKNYATSTTSISQSFWLLFSLGRSYLLGLEANPPRDRFSSSLVWEVSPSVTRRPSPGTVTVETATAAAAAAQPWTQNLIRQKQISFSFFAANGLGVLSPVGLGILVPRCVGLRQRTLFSVRLALAVDLRAHNSENTNRQQERIENNGRH